MEIVFPPILDSFLVLDSEETPVTRDAKTSGTAISFNRLMNIVPNGAIQLLVKTLHPKEALIIPYISPAIRPIIIFQCSARFFIIGGAM